MGGSNESLLSIITSQRERFKQRNIELETVSSTYISIYLLCIHLFTMYPFIYYVSMYLLCIYLFIMYPFIYYTSIYLLCIYLFITYPFIYYVSISTKECQQQKQTVSVLQREVDTLRGDNVKMYEKIRFLQSYPSQVSL